VASWSRRQPAISTSDEMGFSVTPVHKRPTTSPAKLDGDAMDVPVKIGPVSIAPGDICSATATASDPAARPRDAKSCRRSGAARAPRQIRTAIWAALDPQRVSEVRAVIVTGRKAFAAFQSVILHSSSGLRPRSSLKGGGRRHGLEGRKRNESDVDHFRRRRRCGYVAPRLPRRCGPQPRTAGSPTPVPSTALSRHL